MKVAFESQVRVIDDKNRSSAREKTVLEAEVARLKSETGFIQKRESLPKQLSSVSHQASRFYFDRRVGKCGALYTDVCKHRLGPCRNTNLGRPTFVLLSQSTNGLRSDLKQLLKHQLNLAVRA